MNKNPIAGHLRPLNQIDSRLESIVLSKTQKGFEFIYAQGLH